MDPHLYSHGDDEDFEQYMAGSISPNISVNLPVGETLVVNGPRQIPMIITITNVTERNPKRDARMLASVLSCSLDNETIFHLTEYLFTEFLAPVLKGVQGESSIDIIRTAPKRSPRKKKAEETPDGPQDS